jgi:hypothetical protein
LLDRLGEAMSRKNIDNVLVPQHFISYLELQRKKNLIKITRDNRRLLTRIQDTVPTYHPEEWEKDAEKHVEYLRNMTEFPHLFVPPGSASTRSQQLQQQQQQQRPFSSTSTRRPFSSTNNQEKQQLSPGHFHLRVQQSEQDTQEMLFKEALMNITNTNTNYNQQYYNATNTANTNTNNNMMTPEPPPLPPIKQLQQQQQQRVPQLQHTSVGRLQQQDGHEDSTSPPTSMSRNQFISRPFLPNIHMQTTNQTNIR